MQMTAQPQASKLETYNRRYLALKRQIDRERNRFHYPAELVTQMTTVRNGIIEMQNARRKDRKPLPVERLTEGGERQWI